MHKKLYKSRTNKMISGVLGGLGEYFNLDPVLLRVGYVAVSVFTAIIPGAVTYVLMAIIIPENFEITQEETKEAKE